MKFGAIILAAGRGERYGGDKVAVNLGGRPVWRWSFDRFLAHPGIEAVGIVVAPAAVERYQAAAPQAAFVVAGGATRSSSVRAGLGALTGCDAALIHDGARPFVRAETIEAVMDAVRRGRAAAPALPVTDTLRSISLDGARLVDREGVYAMQTPQGAPLDVLRRAYALDEDATDDLGMLERLGIVPELVPGAPENFKVTTMDDMRRAVAWIGAGETRTGIGYDVHRFSDDPERPLWLAGLRFDGRGLEGHSDADVALHALVDALLGAAGLGDIGLRYPNTDPRWKDRPSIEFVKETAEVLANEGWQIVNADLSIVAERPKIMSRRAEIAARIGAALGIDADRVSVKATTNEGLGFIGRGEGVAAMAVATLRRNQ